MARKRAGGATAYAVSLVIFVILFVFSTLIAILLYMQNSAAEERAIRSAAELTKVATASERSSLETELSGREKGVTIVGQLQQDLRALKQWIVNSPTASMDEVRAKIEAAGVGKNDTLLVDIQRLRRTEADNDQRVKTFEDAKKAAEARVKSLEGEKLALNDSYKQAVDSLQAQLTGMESLHKNYEATVAQNTKGLEVQLASEHERADKAIADVQSKIKQMEQEILSLRKRNKELEKQIIPVDRSHPLVDSATQVDGHIAATLADQGLVYIDRGRKDRVLSGLTFEVFDKFTGVSRNEVGDIRGKASIEIINVGENSSIARVVRLERGKTVVDGDLIVNAVYDPNARFKFVVFGEFDIDNSGQATTSDRRRIETKITQWGGIVSDELSFDSDFLILGQEPKLPDALPPSVVDPEKIERHAAQTRRYRQYHELAESAKALGVPILNQNRFLALVGYYQR